MKQKLTYEIEEIREKFKDLFDYSLDLIYAHDLRGKFLDANDIALITLGFKREEISDISFIKLIDNDQLEKAFNVLKEIKEYGRQIKPSEYKLKGKCGNTIYLETYGIPLKKDGKVFGILGIAKDITAKKQTKQKLKQAKQELEELNLELENIVRKRTQKLEESEKKYGSVLENINEGYFEVDIKGNFTFFNDALCRISGYTKEELINMHYSNIFDADIRKKFSNIYNELYQKGEGSRLVDYQATRKDGKNVFHESSIYLRYNSNGETIGFKGFIRDITERKNAEEKIKQSHNDLYQIFNASIPMCITDINYNITEVNERLCNLFQIKKTEIIGKKCYDICKASSCNTSDCSLRQILSGKEQHEYEIKKDLDNGKQIYCIVKNFPFYSQNNKIIGIIKTFTDISSRKFTERKLIASEKKYRKLIETSTMGFMNINLKNNYIDYINPKFLEIMGYERKELEDQELFHTILYPEDYKELIGTRKSQKIEFRIITKDGEIKWLSGARLFQYNSIGELTNLKLWVQEITEKKKMEQKLRGSEEKYRFLFESSPNSIALLDRKGKIKDINIKFERTFGYIRDELIGKRFMRLQWFYPKDLPFVMETFKLLLNGEIPKPIEMRQRKKDGTHVWVHVLFSFITIDTEEFIQVIAQDISRIKESEIKIKESEAKYRSVLENINEGYFEVDLKGNFTFFNDALCKISGYSREELENKSYSMIFDEETKKKIFGVYNDLYTRGEGTILFDYQIITKDGRKKYHESSVYLRYGANEKIAGFKGFVRDISERKKAEALRKKFSQELEKEVDLRTKELKVALDYQKLYLDQILKSSHFKTEFMATMSHELRTPLNAIIGFTDLLLEEIYGQLNSGQLEYIKDIEDSSKHLLDMITQILDISKIESGQVTITIDKIQLTDMVEQVISTLKPLYRKKNLNFELRGLKKKQIVFADLLKLKQIIYNLLSNAIKFTEEGIILIEFIDKKDNWEFHVKDTGIGIAEKDFDIIFKDFKRVKSPHVDSMPGAGMGLSLTKRIIQLHGGEISFTSKIGKGSTFSFYIPKKIKNIDSRLSVEDLLNYL